MILWKKAIYNVILQELLVFSSCNFHNVNSVSDLFAVKGVSKSLNNIVRKKNNNDEHKTIAAYLTKSNNLMILVDEF